MRSHIVSLDFALTAETYCYYQAGPTNFNLQRLNVSSSTTDAITVALYDATLGVLLLSQAVTPAAGSAQSLTVLSQELMLPSNAYVGVQSSTDITADVTVRLIGEAG